MESYLGQIILFAGTFAPVGWAFCNGASLPVSGNEALYALLGVTYGGDGATAFNLPDLRGRLPIGLGTGEVPNATPPVPLPNYPLAAKGGSENITITISQTPVHTHALNVAPIPATTNIPTSNLLAQTADKTAFYFNPPSTPPTGVTLAPTPLSTTAIQPQGENIPHTNIMPTVGINYLICTTGIFPA